MRLFFLLLVLSWLLGILLGVVGSPWLLLVVSMMGIIIFCWHFSLAHALTAGIVMVGVVGYIYGWPLAPRTAVCEHGQELQGTVIGQPHYRPTYSQYVVATAGGCHIQVTSARFPEYRSGDILNIQGGALRPLIDWTQNYSPRYV
ncbi:MAG: hypothetical protein WEA04_01035 [Candidatus Andersenbacteria bacterium]